MGTTHCRDKNAIVTASVVLNILLDHEGFFCEGCENYAVNQSSHHNLNDDYKGHSACNIRGLIISQCQ
jgi:hypothetical protein